MSITVHVKYGDVEKTFSGSLEDVWLCINRFFSEFIPTFETARKLTLRIDLEGLVKDCEGLIGFSQKEGACLLTPKNRLTDNETLLLWLLAYHIGFRLGFVESDAVSRDELQAKLGKTAKITSTRLSELIKNGLTAKTADDKYRITSFGVTQMQKEIIPKIKAKTSNL
ncbi:MAG: hypothetical protein QXI91_07380 [Candidatus Bathyarchaeia archaeon]